MDEKEPEGLVFQDDYIVTRDGKVYNKKRKCYLSIEVTSVGYQRISINKKNYRVHRLVAELYIPKPDGKDFVNHIDHNKSNNCVENLEWVTGKENSIAARDAGKFDCCKILQYSSDGKVFLEEFASNIYRCCSGQRKTAGGFVWKYKDEN
jgi:hypothetical protein